MSGSDDIFRLGFGVAKDTDDSSRSASGFGLWNLSVDGGKRDRINNTDKALPRRISVFPF